MSSFARCEPILGYLQGRREADQVFCGVIKATAVLQIPFELVYRHVDHNSSRVDDSGARKDGSVSVGDVLTYVPGAGV